MTDNTSSNHANQSTVKPLIQELEPLLALLDRVSREGGQVVEDVTASTALEAYCRVVREFRAVALDARERVERAESVVVEAAEFARHRRRRAVKAAARAQTHGPKP